jgi:Aspartyl protease
MHSTADDAATFELVHHLVVVSVVVNGETGRLVFDSGIGITTLSSTFFERAGGELSGASFTGRRMSGQEVSLPLGVTGAVECGPFRREELAVGVLDLDGLPPELADVGGFLSLAFFEEGPLTVDYARQELRRGSAEGSSVPLELNREGPSLDSFMTLVLPSGREIRVEVDMGSDDLILDESFAAEVGVDLDDPSLRRIEGSDETGHRYVRTFARVGGSVHPAGAPELAQERPAVMFQRIVHDGLVGHEFLSRFTVTWDLSGSRLVFS